MNPVIEPNAVACPATYCGALPFHPCIDKNGLPLGRFHDERRKAAAASGNRQHATI